MFERETETAGNQCTYGNMFVCKHAASAEPKAHILDQCSVRQKLR